MAAAVLLPVWTAVMVASKDLADLGSLRVLVPGSIRTGGFGAAVGEGHLLRYLGNSVAVSGAITLLQLMTSILAGYAFAFCRFPARRALLVLVVATMMVPTEVAMVVNYETVQRLGWVDTYAALIVPFGALGLGTFLLRQAFSSLPGELRDAAAVDGHGHLSFLVRVAAPMVRPTIAALGVISFLAAWNQYLWPLLVTNDEDHRTIQVGLRSLATENAAQLNIVMAGTLLAVLPILVVLVAFQRQIVRGLTTGAVKG